jgi:hypothetical protein
MEESMNSKKLLLVVVLAAFVSSAVALPALAQNENEDQAKPQEKEKVYIPKDVKAVLEKGLANRQGETGIPVTVVQHLFFPYYRAQNLLHNVFQVRLKNADLGFVPVKALAATAAKPEEKKPEEKKETTSAFEEVPATDMQANFDFFLQFREMVNNVPGKIVKEVYVPTEIIIPAKEYNPDQEGVYFVGYDLAPGNYLLVAAVQRVTPGPDKKKLQTLLGSIYFEFATPDPAKLEGKLETTPLLITKDITQLPAQETRTFLHRDSFTYLVLKIIPNAAMAIPQKAKLDILYFVLGAKANDQGKFALDTNMVIKSGDKDMIKYSSTVYESPYVSLPLPLQQTVKITSGDTERTETRDLAPGKYVLVVSITDKVGGGTVTKTMNFEVL